MRGWFVVWSGGQGEHWDAMPHQERSKLIYPSKNIQSGHVNSFLSGSTYATSHVCFGVRSD